jgi:hypothetical protein
VKPVGELCYEIKTYHRPYLQHPDRGCVLSLMLRGLRKRRVGLEWNEADTALK